MTAGSSISGGYGLGGYGVQEYGTPTLTSSTVVRTDTATDIESTTATLQGTLSDLGDVSRIEVAFEWGPADSGLQYVTRGQSLSETGSFTATVDGLVPEETYSFRAVASATNGQTTGVEQQFTTASGPIEIGSEAMLLPRDGEIENAWFDSNHAGYTGDGFVNFRQSDSYVRWTVVSDTAAEYDLTIRYALGDDDRSGRLVAGDTLRQPTVASTGSWTSWETTTERVELSKGTSTIRVEATGEDFGNVDAVFLDRIETEPPSEQILLPRDGEIENAWFDSNHAGYTGDGFVNFQESDSYVEWLVESADTAVYDVTIRYALGNTERTGLLTTGNTQQKLTVSSTGGWTDWETVTVPVTLSKGTSTVRIEATGEDFGNVDVVELTPREPWDSKQFLPRDGEIENARFDSNHAGYTGDGFVNFRRSDSAVEWEVLNGTAGEFDLTVRYALGNSDRTGQLTAGTTEQEVTVESTGSWTAWETTTEQVTLPNGASTIRIEATGDDFGNVDSIELERIS